MRKYARMIQMILGSNKLSDKDLLTKLYPDIRKDPGVDNDYYVKEWLHDSCLKTLTTQYEFDEDYNLISVGAYALRKERFCDIHHEVHVSRYNYAYFLHFMIFNADLLIFAKALSRLEYKKGTNIIPFNDELIERLDRYPLLESIKEFEKNGMFYKEYHVGRGLVVDFTSKYEDFRFMDDILVNNISISENLVDGVNEFILSDLIKATQKYDKLSLDILDKDFYKFAELTEGYEDHYKVMAEFFRDSHKSDDVMRNLNENVVSKLYIKFKTEWRVVESAKKLEQMVIKKYVKDGKVDLCKYFKENFNPITYELVKTNPTSCDDGKPYYWIETFDMIDNDSYSYISKAYSWCIEDGVVYFEKPTTKYKYLLSDYKVGKVEIDDAFAKLGWDQYRQHVVKPERSHEGPDDPPRSELYFMSGSHMMTRMTTDYTNALFTDTLVELSAKIESNERDIPKLYSKKDNYFSHKTRMRDELIPKKQDVLSDINNKPIYKHKRNKKKSKKKYGINKRKH